MHSFLACFPFEYQITNHEGAILDVLVVVSPYGLEILCCSKAGGQPSLFYAVDFQFSGVVCGKLVVMLILGDPKAMSEGSTASAP